MRRSDPREGGRCRRCWLTRPHELTATAPQSTLETLVAAARLHEIGYSSQLRDRPACTRSTGSSRSRLAERPHQPRARTQARLQTGSASRVGSS